MKQAIAAAQILGRIHRAGRGDVFLVASRSQPGKLYRVEVLRARLQCPCKASVYTGRCSHRTAVREFLLCERAEQSIASVAPPRDAGVHETLLNRHRPFSLMK